MADWKRSDPRACGDDLQAEANAEAARIEADIDLVKQITGLSFENFRPDRNAAAGGALPKVAGTTR